VFFVLKKVLTLLALPPANIILLVLLGLLVLKRHRRTGRGLLIASFVLLILFSTPPLPLLLERSLAVSGPLDLAAARSAQAIVVLTAGPATNVAEFGDARTESVTILGLERARYAARVARLTGLPILVSGGVVFTGKPESELMRVTLEQEFGVPVRWTETRSRDTQESAIASQRMLAANSVTRILLVTHSVDMRRAVAEFRATGLEVIAAPTKLPPSGYGGILSWIPNSDCLGRTRHALYEVLALAAKAGGLD
jgi:uncharacterized SAM-binding protein YcdF (DUF218 family)